MNKLSVIKLPLHKCFQCSNVTNSGPSNEKTLWKFFEYAYPLFIYIEWTLLMKTTFNLLPENIWQCDNDTISFIRCSEQKPNNFRLRTLKLNGEHSRSSLHQLHQIFHGSFINSYFLSINDKIWKHAVSALPRYLNRWLPRTSIWIKRKYGKVCYMLNPWSLEWTTTIVIHYYYLLS